MGVNQSLLYQLVHVKVVTLDGNLSRLVLGATTKLNTTNLFHKSCLAVQLEANQV